MHSPLYRMNAIAESPSYHKRSAFEPELQALASRFQALAHPARLAILLTLAERRACVCGELVDVLPLAQATVSRHLKELKDAGLVQGEVEGPRSCYCLSPEGVTLVQQLSADFLGKLSAACCTPTDSSCC
jgi:ArsR family transcriptional regulator